MAAVVEPQAASGEMPTIEAAESEIADARPATPPVPAPSDSPVTDSAPAIISEPGEAMPASQRGDVRWMQQRLKEWGYYPGPIDGRAGQATRDAIRAYQLDQALPQDGAATPTLQDFMWRNGG